jgi:hypothetical protein
MKKRVAEPPVSNTAGSNPNPPGSAASAATQVPYQLQPPSTLNHVARRPASDLKYQPTQGETKCNLFMSDFAVEAFRYSGFVDGAGVISADDTIDLMRTGRDNWKALYDRKRLYLSFDLDDLRLALERAITLSNQGYLVIYGLRLSPHGHVAVGVTGNSVQSAKWAGAGLPRNVPLVAQAGETVFAERGLSYGIGPANFKQGQFVIYVRSESSPP